MSHKATGGKDTFVATFQQIIPIKSRPNTMQPTKRLRQFNQPSIKSKLPTTPLNQPQPCHKTRTRAGAGHLHSCVCDLQLLVHKVYCRIKINSAANGLFFAYKTICDSATGTTPADKTTTKSGPSQVQGIEVLYARLNIVGLGNTPIIAVLLF